MRTEAFEKEIGFVKKAKHYLFTIEGLPNVRVHDVIVSDDGGRALVTALSHDTIEAMALDPLDVRPGQRFTRSSRDRQFSMGDHLFGRVINALGDPIDGRGGFPLKNAPFVFTLEAPGLAARGPIVEQLVTGFALIDTVVPIGKGQRQLLMGPVRSGISEFIREVIKNQAGSTTVVVYATIGKPSAQMRQTASELLSTEAAAYTIFLAAAAEDPAPQISIAPAIAFMIAEHYRDRGRDVLLILDDLYTHAKYLREIALLEGQLPGRESYPGDIFFKQASFIERAGCFTGKGAITLLPVLQTDLESYTDLITTNVMGTTDGHLSFSSALFSQGVFPPVSEEESVTRVGKHAQTVVQKQLSTAILSLLSEAKVQERFTQFGTQLSDSAREVIRMGAITRFLLVQGQSERLPVEVQSILLSLVFTTFASGKEAAFFRTNRSALLQVAAEHPELSVVRQAVQSGKGFDDFVRMVEARAPVFSAVCQP